MKPTILMENHGGDDYPVVIEAWGVEQTEGSNHIGPMRKSGDGKVREVVTTIDRRNYKKDVIARNDFHARLIAAAPEMFLVIIDAISELEAADHQIGCLGELKALASRVEGTL